MQRRLKWKLWDAADVNRWNTPPLEWLVEEIIQLGGVGFLSGPPKVGKSLLALDLCETAVRGGLWLHRYQCRPANILYIAREDPPRRVKDRLREILRSTGAHTEAGKLVFIIREPVKLNDSEHVDELKKIIRLNEIDLVILDVVNRMIPGIDENSAADVGTLVDAIEDLRDALGVAILAVDHTRKPSGKKQRVDPFELRGSIAKYGACDFIICVGRRRDGELEVYCENKDIDHAKRFVLTVSPKNSSDPKFQWKEDIDTTEADRKRQGELNRQRVLAAITNHELSRKGVVKLTGLSPSAAGAHLKALVDSGAIESKGTNKNTTYRRPLRTFVVPYRKLKSHRPAPRSSRQVGGRKP